MSLFCESGNAKIRDYVESLRTNSPVSFITIHNLQLALDQTQRDQTLTICPLSACFTSERVNQVICFTRNQAHLQSPESSKAYWGTPNVAFQAGDFDSRIPSLSSHFSQVLLKDLQSDVVDKAHLRRAIAFAHYYLKTRGRIISTIFDPAYIPGQTKSNGVQKFDRLPNHRIQRTNCRPYNKTNTFPELTVDDYHEVLDSQGFAMVHNEPLDIPDGFQSPWANDPISPYRLLVMEKK